MFSLRLWNLLLSIIFYSTKVFSFKMMSMSQKRTHFFSKHSLCMSSSYSSSSSNSGERQKVAIVGGGFGGLYTALSLAELDRRTNMLDISLYDSKDKFVFLPLLYELAVGSATSLEVAPEYLTLLEGSGIKYIQSDVTSINSITRQIEYTESSSTNPQQTEYDQCVIATGTRPRASLISGAAEFAIPFYRVSDVEILQKKLQSRLSEMTLGDGKKIQITVIGAGYSGVEVAINLAEYLRDAKKSYEIHLVDRNSEVMHTSPSFNRITAQTSLASYGIIQHMNCQVNQVDASSVELRPLTADKSPSLDPVINLSSDITILTTGVEASPLVKSISTLKKDKFGRLLTSASLQCLGHPNVFSLGDCSSIQTYRDDPTKALPKTAQVAMQQSSLLAENLYKRALKYPKKPWSHASDPRLDLHYKISQPGELDSFRFIPLGEMVSLGNTDAAMSSLGGLVQLSGPVASAARRLVYAVRMPTNKQRVTAVVSAGVSTATNLFSKFLSKTA